MSRYVRTAVALMLVVAVGAGVAAMAQRGDRSTGLKPMMKMIRLTGWVVDDAGAKKHANAEAKDAVLASHEEGSPLIFWTDEDRFYKIANEEQALSRVGQRWIVMGTLDENETLTIGTFVDPDTGEAIRAKPRTAPKIRTQDAPTGG